MTEQLNEQHRSIFANPILPSDEYIPDPEVHVFGERVYIFGSHDEFNGKMYCDNDYVTWSAPVEDLTDWRYEGVIFKKTDHQSPIKKGKTNMYAPDVAQGPDGAYYLYYSIADSSVISVAKSDHPTGPYNYYGDVKRPNGKVYGEEESDYFEFDPAVLVDGDKVYLYSGSGQKANEKNGHPVVGLFVRELEQDMLTSKREPVILMPADDDRKKPNFFEAASVRKIGEWYYLVYMATDLSGLHYMMSKYPDRGFEHKGLLYSTSKNLLNDGTSVQDAHLIDNNHGSIEEINGEVYVFNHRHTNRSHFSRQVVGDKVTMNEDGTFEPTEYTSYGLRDKPFNELTAYPATMTCGLMNTKDPSKAPYITQETRQDGEGTYSLIKEMIDGTQLEYKSFDLPEARRLSLRIRGEATGLIRVERFTSNHYEERLDISVSSSKWETVEIDFPQVSEPFDVTLSYSGEGHFDIQTLTFH